MNVLNGTNSSIIACQESVDHVSIAGSSWFIGIYFLITTPCCKTFRLNECQTLQTITNTPQALKLSISPSKQAEKPIENNNARSKHNFLALHCSLIDPYKTKKGILRQISPDKPTVPYLPSVKQVK